MVRNVGVVILLGIFGDEFLGVGGLAPEREVPSSMLIGWLHILVISSVARELRLVRT